MKKLSATLFCVIFLFLFTSCSNNTTTNLAWVNSGIKAGPSDGPGYTVYSNLGYNKASETVHISKAKTNLVRKADNKG